MKGWVKALLFVAGVFIVVGMIVVGVSFAIAVSSGQSMRDEINSIADEYTLGEGSGFWIGPLHISFGGGFPNVFFGKALPRNVDYYPNAAYRSYSFDSIDAISCAVVMRDIEIRYGGDKVLVEFYERFEGEFEDVRVSGGSLKVHIDNKWASYTVWSEHTMAESESKVIITIPEGSRLDDVSVVTVSGDISVESLDAGSLQCTTVSGDMRVEGGTPGGLVGSTVSGSCLVRDAQIEQFRFNSVSGDATLRLLNRESHLDIEFESLSGHLTLNGDRLGRDVSFGSGACRITFESVSGDLTVATGD